DGDPDRPGAGDLDGDGQEPGGERVGAVTPGRVAAPDQPERGDGMSIDLRELMQERAAVADLAPAGDRLGAVYGRIVAVKRRRLAGTVAAICVLVAAIAVGALNVPLGRDNSSPKPAVTNSIIDGFAEYSDGARVIATAVGHLPQTQVSIT